MNWNQDAQFQEAIRKYLENQKDDLGELLNALTPFQDGSPPFQFLKVWGMFVFRYCSNIEKNTESDAWDLTLAEVSNDPTVQRMVGSIVANNLDRGLGV